MAASLSVQGGPEIHRWAGAPVVTPTARVLLGRFPIGQTLSHHWECGFPLGLIKDTVICPALKAPHALVCLIAAAFNVARGTWEFI